MREKLPERAKSRMNYLYFPVFLFIVLSSCNKHGNEQLHALVNNIDSVIIYRTYFEKDSNNQYVYYKYSEKELSTILPFIDLIFSQSISYKKRVMSRPEWRLEFYSNDSLIANGSCQVKAKQVKVSKGVDLYILARLPDEFLSYLDRMTGKLQLSVPLKPTSD